MKKQALFLSLLMFILFSCGKEEGVGGKNTIIGAVIEEVIENDTVKSTYPLPEKDVYIIYGDKGYYADRIKTNFDGTFRFERLFKGDYKVFTYSECPSCPSGSEAVFEFVNLPNRKDELIIDTLYVKKYY